MNIIKTLLTVTAVLLVKQVLAYDQLTVTYYQVGPGNCVLVQCPGPEDVNLLLDCGSHRAKYKNEVFHELLEQAAGNTTHLFLTHTDKDHYIWVDDIFELGDLPMGNVYAGGRFNNYYQNRPPTSQTLRELATGTIYGQGENYNNTPGQLYPVETFPVGKRKRDGTRDQIILEAVQRLVTPQTVMNGTNNICGDARVDILVGNSANQAGRWGERDWTNKQSLVISLSYAGRTFIFPGDATNEDDLSLQRALTQWATINGQVLGDYNTYNPALKVDFMMAPHHGSDTEGSDWSGWASVTQPDHLIFSGDPSQNNISWRHPTVGAYAPYEDFLLETTPHTVQFKDPTIGTGVKPVTTNAVSVTKAVFPLHDVSDVSVTVYPSPNPGVKGNVEIGCMVPWCGTDFFDEL
ncbi:MAG: hypothetical protein MI867_03015 [Pseudomonadales bacterium]|nr:hypothetical protein [Pseudomonadales bacterium]